MIVLNIRETASLLRVSVSTIRKLVKNNEIPHFRIAYHLYFNQETIEQWVKNQEMINNQKTTYEQDEIKSCISKKDTMYTPPSTKTHSILKQSNIIASSCIIPH